MLEDMRYSGMVRRICLEADREDIVLVLSGNMQIVGSSLVVLQVQSWNPQAYSQDPKLPKALRVER